MYTLEEVDAFRKRLEAKGVSKAEIIQAISMYCLGWPYVFGAWGCLCTPGNRRTYANRCRTRHPEYADKIINACPVLSGKRTACDGCDWQGCGCNDCRGFTHMLLEMVGLQLYGDTVSTQWSTKSNWVVQGNIADMPYNLVCCIFRTGHTGMYLGDGITRHCSTNVKQEPMPGKPKWLQFGIPAGLYTTEELRKAGFDVSEEKNTPTIRKGAKGTYVKVLQDLLNNHGYAMAVDSIFGRATETAVKDFQTANGLKADGIVGPKTWAALGVNFDDGEDDHDVPEIHDEPLEDDLRDPDDVPDMVNVPRAWLESIADVLEDIALDVRGYAGK